MSESKVASIQAGLPSCAAFRLAPLEVIKFCVSKQLQLRKIHLFQPSLLLRHPHRRHFHEMVRKEVSCCVLQTQTN